MVTPLLLLSTHLFTLSFCLFILILKSICSRLLLQPKKGKLAEQIALIQQIDSIQSQNRAILSDSQPTSQKLRKMSITQLSEVIRKIRPNKYKTKVIFSFIILTMASHRRQEQLMRQHERTEQQLTQDQRSSHGSFFCLLSTLQSLLMQKEGRHEQDFNHKMFSYYDETDYRYYTREELINQLIVQINLNQTSRMFWKGQNKGMNWQFPSDFSRQEASRFLKKCQLAFQKSQDDKLLRLTEDVKNLLNGNFHNLNCEKMQLTKTEERFDKAGFVKGAMKAGSIVEQRNEQVKDMKRSQLVSHVNKQTASEVDFYIFPRCHENLSSIKQWKYHDLDRFYYYFPNSVMIPCDYTASDVDQVQQVANEQAQVWKSNILYLVKTKNKQIVEQLKKFQFVWSSAKRRYDLGQEIK